MTDATDTPTIEEKEQTPPTDDRSALRNVNRLFQSAMRADWKLHAAKLSPLKAPGDQLAHEAACAWGHCAEALQELKQMPAVDETIVRAAIDLEAVMPPDLPDLADIGIRSAMLFQTAKPFRKQDPELADLMQETGCLLQVHVANLQLMSIRPGGDS